MSALRALRSFRLGAGLMLALGACVLAVASPARAALPIGEPLSAVTGNPADTMADAPLEGGSYDRATTCFRQPRRGALALVRYLPELSPHGVSWGIMRCERWGTGSASLHAEGRAVDWHLSRYDAAEAREADRLVRLLLAPDAAGRPAALARRMGVQGIIWDCRAWWGGPVLVRYSACIGKSGRWKKRVNTTIAHRDHVHIELSKAGAALRTSWWTDGPGRSIAARYR